MNYGIDYRLPVLIVRPRLRSRQRLNQECIHIFETVNSGEWPVNKFNWAIQLPLTSPLPD